MPTLGKVLLLLATFCLCLGACQAADDQEVVTPTNKLAELPPESTPMTEIHYFNAKYAPPDGRTLLIIGQDTDSIDDYVESMKIVPGGVTNYTSVRRLEGIHKVANYGSGPHHLDYLAETYPNSVIAVGLYMVSHLKLAGSGAADAQIDLLLDALVSYNRPVFVRFGYEFDGSWNHYDPEAYVMAFQRFHKRMR
jgi:hypothetical protein